MTLLINEDLARNLRLIISTGTHQTFTIRVYIQLIIIN
jgi:hypothetical protein